MDLKIEDPTMPTINTSTAAKEARPTFSRGNVEIDSAYPLISVNSDITSGKRTSALKVLQARLQSTRAIPLFRDDEPECEPDAGETREAEEDASAEASDEPTVESTGDSSANEEISEDAPPDDVELKPHEEETNNENVDVPDHDTIEADTMIDSDAKEDEATQIIERNVSMNNTNSSFPPITKIVAAKEEESIPIPEEREGVEAAASTTTTTAMTTAKPRTLRNGILLPNEAFWNALKAATAKALSEVNEEYGVILPNDAFWNAANEATTKALSEVTEEYGALLPDDIFWSAVNEATTKALGEVNEEDGAFLPDDTFWSAVTEETTKVLGKMNEEFTKAYEEMSIQVNKFIETAKTDTNTGSNTTQLDNGGALSELDENGGALSELDGARAVLLTDCNNESTTATGENIEVEYSGVPPSSVAEATLPAYLTDADYENAITTGEFIEVEYSGDPPRSITEETLPAYPLVSVNSEITSNKKTSALGVLRAGLRRTRAIPFAKTHKAEKA